MSEFVNKRIEKPFSEVYKGYNQFLFTGDIEDYFLVDGANDGSDLRCCKLVAALENYGRKQCYDVVITLQFDKEGKLQLNFGSEGQRQVFEGLRGDSSRLFDGSQRGEANKFQPRAPRPRPGQPLAQPGERQAASKTREAEDAGKKNDTVNLLGRITQALKREGLRVLVIFFHPEDMMSHNDSIRPEMIEPFRILVNEWRDIVQEAHSDSRTVFIVNNHRKNAFRAAEHQLSSFDHCCREINIAAPDIAEMREWLRIYRMENGIFGTSRDEARVALTGKAYQNGNLKNFVAWVQSFYLQHSNNRTWDAILKFENREAVESKEDLLERLDGMIGLDSVKAEVHKIVDYVENDNANAVNGNYHMFFVGSPGTGKTVVANIVASLFWAMELRVSRKVVELKIQDVVNGGNEGIVMQKMKDKVQEAMGGVLFIDEAYLFAESDWGRQAFQILLTEMENNRTNLTVILAGYEERLQDLKDINPGIERRVPRTLKFADYKPEEKLAIFKYHLGKLDAKSGAKHVLAPGVEEKLLSVLAGIEGNGGGVCTYLDQVLANVGAGDTIREEHVVDPHAVHPDMVKKVLAEIDRDFIGQQTMKECLRRFFHSVQWDIDRRAALGLSRRAKRAYRIRFVGPPGTGKTTMARYMGKFFHAMGICKTDQYVERDANSLKGAYLGHAQKAVNDLFHENRGKVIFIDEIYSLCEPDRGANNQYGRESINTMVRCLTAPEYQDTVVIVAGYKQQVDDFMKSNPGLPSRIPTEIVFADYSPEECLEIFKHMATNESYVLAPENEPILIEYFTWLKRSMGNKFGNARDVNGVFTKVISNMTERLAEVVEKTPDDYRNITRADIPRLPDREEEKIPVTDPVAD